MPIARESINGKLCMHGLFWGTNSSKPCGPSLNTEYKISAINNLYQNSFQNTKDTSQRSPDQNEVFKVTISFVKNILSEHTWKWFLISV